MELSRLTRDGTAEPVSRDQILRHARGQGNIIFPVQLTTSRIGNLTRLIYSLLYVMTIHTYTHTLLRHSKRHHGSSNGKAAKSSFAWRALVSFTSLVDQADMKTSAPVSTLRYHYLGRPASNTWGRFRRQCSIP